MKILNLNCQHGEQPHLKDFLEKTMLAETYDFLILQEVNEKVLAFLHQSPYKTIHAFNKETGQNSEVCIVHRIKYSPLKTDFKSFAFMHRDPVFGFKHPCIGMLWADFLIEEKIMRIASIHLHSGIHRNVRITELKLAKNLLLSNISGPVMLAGDFNSGWSEERINNAKALAPEFAWITKDLGPTLDSRYCENVAHLPNRIAALLGIFNIGIQLRTDHIFVDKETACTSNIKCNILSDRVSDHNPVECVIKN